MMINNTYVITINFYLHITVNNIISDHIYIDKLCLMEDYLNTVNIRKN